MVSVNDINHFAAGEILTALEEEIKGSGRGAYRPDEIPGLVVDALAKWARNKDTRANISLTHPSLRG